MGLMSLLLDEGFQLSERKLFVFCVGEKVFGLGLDLQLHPMGLIFLDENFQLSEMKLFVEEIVDLDFDS